MIGSVYRKTVFSLLLSITAVGQLQAAEPTPPNIMLILADDMGFNDMGVMGGEIATPTLDSLADEGLLMTNFYTAPTCSMTRAKLMTGTDNHLVGLGQMKERKKAPNQMDNVGYVGYLNEHTVTIAERLKDAGYSTYITGKWHLGMEEEQSPHARGFERSFVLLDGGASHFDLRGNFQTKPDAPYREDGKSLSQLPEGFFSTTFYTDKMIEYIGDKPRQDKPFFAYVAYTAPHWPLMAPQEWIAKYQGRYDQGYEVLREERLNRMKQLGVLDKSIEAYPFWDKIPAWDSLTAEEKKTESRKMEVYAAMVAQMDNQIQRLIDHLKAIDEYDNTLLVFLSDNGAAGDNPFKIMERWEGSDKYLATYDLNYENMGLPNSYVFYGTPWALAGTAPFRHFKGFPTEGGIRTPAIIRLPGAKAHQSDAVATLKDLPMTFLDIAGVEPQNHYKGRPVYPMTGKSLLPLVAGEAKQVHSEDEMFGWEISNNRAVRQGNWKIVNIEDKRFNTERWELYNLADDPTELNDLSKKKPQKLTEMKQTWQRYADRNNVILADWSAQPDS